MEIQFLLRFQLCICLLLQVIPCIHPHLIGFRTCHMLIGLISQGYGQNGRFGYKRMMHCFSSPYYLLGGIFGKFPFLAEFHIPQSEKPVDFNRNTPTYESASLQVNAQEDFCFCKHLYFKSSFAHFYFFPLLVSSQYSSVCFRIFSYKVLYISLE